jgi:hypothetical protein
MQANSPPPAGDCTIEWEAHGMTFHAVFLIIMAVLTFVVMPIALVWTFVDGMRRKSSDRPRGGGGISNIVGGAMLELDRFVRPSVEHTIEAEHQTLKRDDDTGGD